jgi:hypothetical protein
MPPMSTEEDSVPTARVTAATRRELRRVGNRPLWMPPCMLRSSLVSIGIVPVLRMRSRIGFHGRPSFALSPAGAAGASGGGAARPLGRHGTSRAIPSAARAVLTTNATEEEGRVRDALWNKALLSGCGR